MAGPWTVTSYVDELAELDNSPAHRGVFAGQAEAERRAAADRDAGFTSYVNEEPSMADEMQGDVGLDEVGYRRFAWY